jgi:uncharacterized membrane protein YphA (DoxX/SURF4 family)
VTYVSYIAELVLGITFLAAGSGKARRLSKFERDLAGYDVLPLASVRPLSRALPATEVIVGLAILAGVVEPVPLSVASVLLFAFATGMAHNLVRGRNIECGCSGKSSRISWKLVVRNLTLATLAVVAFAAAKPAAGLRELAGTGELHRSVAVAFAAGLVLVGVEIRAVVAAIDLSRKARSRLPTVLRSAT